MVAPKEEKSQPVGSGSSTTSADKNDSELFRLSTPKFESNIKVTGKIDLEALNQSTRPKKKSKEEKRKERDEKQGNNRPGQPNFKKDQNKQQGGTPKANMASNEEGDGKGGVKEVARVLKESGNIPDFCIVGEPSSERVFGDTVKVGRRGSLSVLITVEGTQGHVAYPERVDNPIHKAAALIGKLSSRIDNGNEFFPPTSFEVTNIHAGTGAENVVPAKCEFLCNFRFNNLQSKESLERLIKNYLNELNIKATLDFRLNGLPFITESSQAPQSAAFKLRAAISSSIEEVTGLKTQFSTSGGTSDGRFIAPLGAQVIEFGPISATIHKVNVRL